MQEFIEKRIKKMTAYGQSLPGAEVYFREDWGTVYFSLLGKQFGLMNPAADPQAKITLKNLPKKNEELRELYSGAIIPGYYANKTHWNSVLLSSKEVSDEQIEQLILESYQLVRAKLTKSERKTLLMND